jgi:hypothetical protein
MALSGRMSKRKSAAAIARRMAALTRVLAKRRQTYAGISGDELVKKFRYYKLAGVIHHNKKSPRQSRGVLKISP